MQLVMFERAGRQRLGALHGDHVIDLAAASAAAKGQPLDQDATATPPLGPLTLRTLRILLASGDQGLDDAHQAYEFATTEGDESLLVPLGEVRLRAPIANPRKLLALAGNYAAHVREGGREPAPKERSAPQVFMKPPTTLIGPDDPIRLPGDLCAAVAYEGELGVVIGRLCRNVSEGNAIHHIAGYVNFNDVSGRRLTLPFARDATPRTAFFDWLNGKWFDTFGPIGPAVVTIDEIHNPHALALQTRINGEVRQQASTADMLFSVTETIAWISRFVTLEPGDIIATGTPPSTAGSTSGQFLQPGDVVEVEITGLGILRNPVVGPAGDNGKGHEDAPPKEMPE